RGKGAVVWDAEGKRYLDFYAGIAVSALGHGHPRLTRAIAEQAERLIHVSNYFFNEPNVRLAERLCRLTGMARAFFCNSGTEAIEASLKLVRRHFYSRGQTERLRVIAFDNSFHGRTLGALAATGQSKYRDGFGPLPGVTHVAYGDLAAVERALGPDVAAILVEPVQGEGGVLPAPPGFLNQLRALTEQHGALLVFDEVQTGVGRTGTFLACQAENVEPDVVALAKGLGGGVPIGSMLCKAKLSDALPPGSHGSTFGGNPLASAAALAVLDAIEHDGLLEHVKALGGALSLGLEALGRKHEKRVSGVRGKGLLQALLLRDGVDARQVLGKLQDAGVLLTVAGGQALRFSPPLVVTSSELEEALAKVDVVLGSLGG
ncbi:MAG TPA: acetylornithine/succinylornithine family transaminase, partial [Polyangiaceae bacterium]|nr:acetylornithine/succinylornithine family transaminase [Polyangiaceae bacterium]